ncbi:hypothetical protein DYI26_19350 [Halomonas litopenaei]|nr:hypothetical protein [Halomonas litopenaei]
MKSVSATIKNASAKIQGVAAVKVGSYLNNCSPASRAAFFAGVAMATGAQSAMAQDGGFAGTASTVADQGSSIADSAGTIFMALGFVIAGWGGLNMYKRSRETRDDGQPQTPVMKIVGPWVAGALLAGTGAFMTLGGETIGIQESDYGNVPG